MPEAEETPFWERLLRKQLLLLATLVVGVTYMAGINPPGGVWQENGSGHTAGGTILRATNRPRYDAFYYCNATALASSVVLIFLLLLKKPRRGAELAVLRVVMVLDLLSLLGAYAAGSSRQTNSTLYITSLSLSVAVFVYMYTLFSRDISPPPREEEELDDQAPFKHKERRKMLMLFASFMAVITYIAGLSSSGGSWDRAESNNWQDSDSLNNQAKVRFKVFLYFNSAAFMASILSVMQLMVPRFLTCFSTRSPGLPSTNHARRFLSGILSVLPNVPILVALLGLLGAYAAGTYRSTNTSAYGYSIMIGLLAYIFFVIARPCVSESGPDDGDDQENNPVGSSADFQLGSNAITRNEEYNKVKPLILLLATLAATVTYQAGMHPPGGVWPDDLDGHLAGYPILLSTQPSRYKVFLYCNSGAFLLSMASILMLIVIKEKIHTTLLVSMSLDMVAIMGAYSAGSWRDKRSSIYVVVMACGVILYLMIHLLCLTLTGTMQMGDTRLIKKRHKRLLLVAILVATITYQAGLNPPGGFQLRKDSGHAAGAVLLMENYPRRFWAFFYCNTVSFFMATLALILFFTSPKLYQRAVRCYALYGCIVLALLCLMAAYAAGAARTVKRCIYLFVLLAMVVCIVGVRTIKSRAFLLKKEAEAEEDDDTDGSSAVFGLAHMPRPRPRPRHIPRPRIRLISAQELKYRQVYARHKHLMLLAVVAASATYQAGLNPPGGLWQDGGDHGGAGSPVLYDSNRKQYLAFFYSNSTSFVLSVFVVAQQLLLIMQRHQPKHRKLLVLATNMALILDLLCLVAAYAAVVARGWEDAIVLFVLVLFSVAIHAAPWIQGTLQGNGLAFMIERSRS